MEFCVFDNEPPAPRVFIYLQQRRPQRFWLTICTFSSSLEHSVKCQDCHRNCFLVSLQHYVSALQGVSWIVGISFGDRHLFKAWQQMRLLFLTLEEVMVLICRRQCWVTVCNGLRKSNINFSENTPTVCQTAEKLNI